MDPIRQQQLDGLLHQMRESQKIIGNLASEIQQAQSRLNAEENLQKQRRALYAELGGEGGL